MHSGRDRSMTTFRVCDHTDERTRFVDSTWVECVLSISIHPPALSWSARLLLGFLGGGFLALCQGLTLVHFSAQHKRFVWDRGCT